MDPRRGAAERASAPRRGEAQNTFLRRRIKARSRDPQAADREQDANAPARAKALGSEPPGGARSESLELAHRRLQQLYEVSKQLTNFEGIETTVAAIIATVTRTLSQHSAIFILETAGGPRTLMWQAEGESAYRLRAAKAHARKSYAYLVGSGSARSILNETSGPPGRDIEAGEKQSFVTLPLATARGPIFGALQLAGTARLHEMDLVFVNAVVNQLAIALDRQSTIEAKQAAAEAKRVAAEDEQAITKVERDAERRRRTAAEALQERYEALVDNIDHAFVWEADAQTFRVSYLSARTELLLGYPRARWVGNADLWTISVHPDERDAVAETFRRALTEKKDQRVEHRCTAANGDVLWLHTGVHVARADTKAPRLQGVSVDVTPSKQAEERIRGQLDFTRAVTGSLGEGVVAVDIDGHITLFNDAAARMLGTNEEDALGRLVQEIVQMRGANGAPITADEFPLDLVMRQGDSIQSEEQLFSSGGHPPFPVSYTSAVLRRGGQISGAVLAFQDIGGRKRAQDALRASEEASAYLAEVVRSSTDAVVTKTLDGTITSWNRGAEHVFGYSADEVQGKSITLIVPEHHQAEEIQILSTVARGERVEHFDTVRKRKDGSLIDVSLTVSPVRDRAGNIIGASKVARDVSDRKRNEQALREAVQAAQTATRAREELLAIVSHDLKNPLGVILMSAAVMGWGYGAKDPRRSVEQIGIIQRAAERMNRLIQDLLDRASIDAGKLSTQQRRVAVAPFVDNMIEALRPLAYGKSVHLKSELPATLPPIFADAGRVQQVFANLVGNAIKFTAPGGAITVRAEQAGGAVQFAVTDTGSGIPDEELPHLFERFWQAKRTARQGTGLGLSIAKGIVAAHGGRIWVESSVGAGTTFFFTLPVATHDATDPTEGPNAIDANSDEVFRAEIEKHVDGNR